MPSDDDANAGPSQERRAFKTGTRKSAQPREQLHPGHARKTTVANVMSRLPARTIPAAAGGPVPAIREQLPARKTIAAATGGPLSARNQIATVVRAQGPARKTISAAAGRPLRPDHARETSGTNTRDGDGDGDRRPISRKIAVPTSQSRTDRPKSTFSYVAPLLRTRTLPTKEGPLLPSAHVAEERRERERRRERDEYALGPTRSAPRTSLPSMSVQRRVVQSPRKQQQSPVSRRAPAMTSARGPVPLDRIPDARVHVGRGGKLVFGSSDSEDESSSSSDVVQAQDARIPNPRWTSGGRAPRRQLSTKAARKTKPAAAQPDPIIRLTKAAKKLRVNIDSDEGTDGRRMLVPGERLARKLQAAPVLVSDAEEVIVLSDSEDDVEELYRALDALTLSEARMQKRKRLPFLLKNLWKGFTYQCQRHGVRTSPPNAPRGAVKVVFKYYLEANDSGASSDSSSDAREYQTYVGSMADWRCPMCELHKPFPTREMLIFHLSRDHSEVKVSWREITVRNEHRWRLDLVIPDIAELADSSSEDEEPADVPQEAEDAVPFPNEDQPEVSGAAPTEQLFLPGSDDEESPPPTTPPTLFSSEEVEEKKVLIRSSTSPTPPTAIKRQSSSPHPRGRPSLATAARTSYRGSLPARYPSPPPPHDKLGPAAQYPYLPEKGEDGQELYSCRIGGPRLFDLVSMLPTEEFGIMAWAVVDREEELFEMEDLRDEDKVVLALWNRWIMLNRASFIFKDYFEGVKLFIKRYWQVIHQAAGWRALREFLITLSVNKFLTFDKVLKSLQYYESLTGMALWYKDDIA